MRMGQQDEPYKELELAYNNGYRDAATVNSLRLIDSYKNFETYRDDQTIIRLNKNEAAPAAALHSVGVAHHHRHLREEIQNDSCPARCRSKSIPTTKTSPCAPPACPASARSASLLARLSQWTAPRRATGRLQLGRDHLARDEPRLHPHRDQPSRAALVYRGARRPRRRPALTGVEQPPHARCPRSDSRQEASPRRQARSRLCIIPTILHRSSSPTFRPAASATSSSEKWGEDKLLDMVHSYAQLETTPHAIQKTSGSRPRIRQAVSAWINQKYGNRSCALRRMASEIEAARRSHEAEAIRHCLERRPASSRCIPNTWAMPALMN